MLIASLCFIGAIALAWYTVLSKSVSLSPLGKFDFSFGLGLAVVALLLGLAFAMSASS